MLLAFLIQILSISNGHSAESVNYEACKNVVVISKSDYKKEKDKWDQVGQTCKIQITEDIGLSSLNPLNEGVKYLEFSQRVAKKVIETLEKSQRYADCSASCFGGASSCPPELSDNDPIVLCSDRKKEIQEAMKINARKIRMELALSNDAPGLLSVNVNNVLRLDKEKRINSNLRDFEIGTPNPVGSSHLTQREFTEAQRRLDVERSTFEKEYKEKGYTNYNDWMSIKLMTKFDEHRERYRSLIYEEAPIFGVIERPFKFENGSDPVWTDLQMAKAFKKLSKNSKSTQKKVHWSINKAKLEFSRINGEAFGRWIVSLAPGTHEKNDLLYYMGMKNQVEEVLKDDPSSCAIAMTMQARLHSKEAQNSGIAFAATFFGSGLIKGVSAITGNVFRIGRALSGAEASGLTGLATGMVYLGDGFRRYHITTKEAATFSGIGGNKEGKSIIKAKDVTAARDTLKMDLILSPVSPISSWKISDSFYSLMERQVQKDMPEIAQLQKYANVNLNIRDEVIDRWVSEKIKSALSQGILSNADKEAFKTKETRNVLSTLISKIEKNNPKFFQKEANMDFFLKVAATTLKKEKNDPSDLGEKANTLLLHFNTEAMNGSWDKVAQKGLLKVFDNAIAELRIAFSKDPATYAKLSTSPQAQEKILMNALRRSGVKEKDIKKMSQCALPH